MMRYAEGKKRSRALALSLLVLTGAGAPSRSAADLRGSLSLISDRLASGQIDWRPGTWRIAAASSGERGRFHLAGAPSGVIDSWVIGDFAVRWGRGASGLPAAPAAGLLLSGTTTSTGARGGGLTLGTSAGQVLIAGGLDDRQPRAILAWRYRGTGFLVAARPVLKGKITARDLLRDAALSGTLAFREGGQRGELEVAGGAGAPPEVRALWQATLPGFASRFELRLPFAARAAALAAHGDMGPSGGRRRSPDPALEIELRASPYRLRTFLRTEAAIPYDEPFDHDNTGSRRIRLDVGIPLHMKGKGGESEVDPEGGSESNAGIVTEARLGADLRPVEGKEGFRLHAELRTSVSRAALDVTGQGGVLARARTLWSIPGPIAVEVGVAAWSGPIVNTGALADLPALPDAALSAPLSTSGQAASVVISWQLDSVRVRLGASSRQLEGGSTRIRGASRVDLARPGD